MHDDDKEIIDAGYQPQLHRSLGFFSSFAVTFSTVSVLMGIFSNFGFVLTKAGPFGLWTWPLVGFGQLLVALVFAEMAGRIPLTGAIYNWNTRLANPAVGWLCAWILCFAYCIGAVGTIVAMIAPLQTLVGTEFDPNTLRYVGVGIIAAHAVINIYGVHLASLTNKIAVISEIIALVVFGLILLVVTLIHGDAHLEFLTIVPQQPTPYWPAFLLSTLLGAWTIIGFELPADLSEETKNVKQVTPKSIISAVFTSAILGFIFLIILTISIPDLTSVTAASDPISAIIASHLGEAATKIFLVSVIVAIFALALLVMAAASRILFAVARDQRVIGAAWLSKVSVRKVPIGATLLIAAIEIVAFLTAKDAVDLYAAVTILFFLVYLITVISFANGLKKLPSPNTFSLKKWRWPTVSLAIIWLVGEIGILTIPEDFHTAAMIAGGVVISGVILYFMTGRKKLVLR